MLRAVTLLLLFQLAGEALARGLHIPVPGPVLGMSLLTAWLLARGRDEAELSAFAQGLLRLLPLFFVPACAGVITQLEVLQREGLAILVALVASTLAAMAVTALTLSWLLKRGAAR